MKPLNIDIQYIKYKKVTIFTLSGCNIKNK